MTASCNSGDVYDCE